MTEQKFRLTLTGRVLEGFERKDVEAALAKLLSMSVEQARGMLQGERSRIRKELSLEKAEHLMQKITKRGAECTLSPVVSDASDEESAPETLAEAPVEASADEAEGGQSLELESVEARVDDESTRPMKVVSVEASEKGSDEGAADYSGETEAGAAQFFEEPRVLADRIEKQQKKLLPYLVLVLVLVVAGVAWFGMGLLSKPDEKPPVADQPKPAAPVEVVPVDTARSTSEQRLDKLASSVKVWMIQYGAGFNPQQVTLPRLGQDMGMPAEDFTDGWGNEIRYEAGENGYRLLSAGPDGAFGTADDLVSEVNL
ncbi:MAG: hypothetical protein ABW085_03595 [Sedimenticola sp.]